jgi:hypothetical protein
MKITEVKLSLCLIKYRDVKMYSCALIKHHAMKTYNYTNS